MGIYSNPAVRVSLGIVIRIHVTIGHCAWWMWRSWPSWSGFVWWMWRSRPSRSGIAWWKWPSRSGLSASVWTSRRCPGFAVAWRTPSARSGLFWAWASSWPRSGFLWAWASSWSRSGFRWAWTSLWTSSGSTWARRISWTSSGSVWAGRAFAEWLCDCLAGFSPAIRNSLHCGERAFWLLRLSESRKIRRGHAGYMMGVPSGSSAIECVLYGDNVAAIGLAHGTSSSSWRTRHLKIWAAYLREALEGRAPGGLYKAPSTSSSCWIGGRCAHQTTFWPGRRDFIGGPWNATWQKWSWAPWWWTSECCHCSDDDWELVAFRYGCETGDDAESMAIWACGTVLMVFGAVYVGQLPMKSMMCCLRRLRGPPQSFEEDNRQRLGGGRRSSVRIKRGKGSSSSNPSSTSLSIKIRPGTGIQHRDENFPGSVITWQLWASAFSAEGDAFAAVLPRTSSTASGSAGAAVLPRTSSTTSGSASAAVLFCCTSMPTWQR